ncbi:5-formyltetrahydrofolate cyclo-ligase [Calothrix sp. 336/3]|uniref:5-formyltetrahydrofolate cyclo-ligase n=1 Tax=Calothrix sp. 336/3 TaxID=1337936 RepID=UPI0004E3AAE3|nr:5-formyltetrahydrofolate cyclo-ligase [Calothrix sp. 336/3]AKG20040.1 5-formyltetrahydrofolate cyclo-ligase [Calothrix sp. 336/3]
MDKIELRRSLLQKRRQMSEHDWQSRSDRLCSHLLTSSLLYSGTTVLAYHSFRQEPDLGSLFTDSRFRWGFPRCVGKSLVWHAWQPGEPWQTGAFGITEPCTDAPTLQAEAANLMLVPCVACDTHGYRLGYGGGYYDRLLSLPEWQNFPTIGIVFDFAFLPQLPIKSWDRKLDFVCTESGLYSAN